LVLGWTPTHWRQLVQEGKINCSTREAAGGWPLPEAVVRVFRSLPATIRLPGEPRPGATSEELEQDRAYDERLQAAWSRAEGIRVVIELEVRARGDFTQSSLSLSPRAIQADPNRSLPQRNLYITTRWDNAPDEAKPPVSPEEAAGDPALSARRRLSLGAKPGETWHQWHGWLTRFLPGLASSYDLNLVADGYRIERFRRSPTA